jgi:predicted nucleic-acid-binding protein
MGVRHAPGALDVAAIDTHALIRLVTRDDPRQSSKAGVFLRQHRPVLVTHLSVLELVRVLMSRYGHGKEKVCEVVRTLPGLGELDVQQPAILEGALRIWEESKADFADCFALESVKAALNGCQRL